MPSSLAQAISNFWPVELVEFLLTRTMTPSDRRIRVRTLSFQPLSYASFTDMSMNSYGARGCTSPPAEFQLDMQARRSLPRIVWKPKIVFDVSVIGLPNMSQIGGTISGHGGGALATGGSPFPGRHRSARSPSGRKSQGGLRRAGGPGSLSEPESAGLSLQDAQPISCSAKPKAWRARSASSSIGSRSITRRSRNTSTAASFACSKDGNSRNAVTRALWHGDCIWIRCKFSTLR